MRLGNYYYKSKSYEEMNINIIFENFEINFD